MRMKYLLFTFLIFAVFLESCSALSINIKIGDINSLVSRTSVGIDGLMEDLTILNCYTNDDCDDGSWWTPDTCVNPGTFDSYCTNEVIDTIPPELSLRYDENGELRISGTDNVDANVDVNCSDALTSILSLIYGKERTCELKDDAGNVLDVLLRYKKTKTGTTTKITRLVYNGNKTIPQSNSFSIDFNQRIIKQTLNVEQQFNVQADYNKRTDQTAITIKEDGNTKTYIEKGLVLINLKTEEGRLKYSL